MLKSECQILYDLVEDILSVETVCIENICVSRLKIFLSPWNVTISLESVERIVSSPEKSYTLVVVIDFLWNLTKSILLHTLKHEVDTTEP